MDLAVNRGEVGVNSAGANNQFFSYLGIGQPHCYQAEYVYFAGGEAIRIFWCPQGIRFYWTHKRKRNLGRFIIPRMRGF